MLLENKDVKPYNDLVKLSARRDKGSNEGGTEPESGGKWPATLRVLLRKKNRKWLTI